MYTLRAHHGLCLCFFKGKGYDDEFIKHMAMIKACLEENPRVCITTQSDVICDRCPNNIDGMCKMAAKVEAYDRGVLDACHLKEGECMPYLEFHRLIKENILAVNKRSSICRSCEWDGLCNE